MTKGSFIPASEHATQFFDWGNIAWLNPPAATGSKDLICGVVEFAPGRGHNFHRHPGQEEVIYCLEGEIEQWLEGDKRTLKAGDALFIGPSVVHASFNVSSAKARVFVVVGPCKGADGYVTEDVFDQAPWNALR